MDDTINQRINIIIKDNHMNPHSFAKSIGVTPSTINSMIEKGTKPSYDLIVKIKEVYDEYSLDWLLMRDGEKLKKLYTDNLQLSTLNEKQEVYAKIDPLAIIKSQQETINRLTDMLYEQNKKVQDANMGAGVAAVG